MADFFNWRDAPEAQFAVIGHPVTHSLSPAMHNAAYEALSLPYRYVGFDVSPDDLAQALDHLREQGYKGVNVTIPHKEAAFRWCDETSFFAKRAGAVNTIKLDDGFGDNTDGPGFLLSLRGLLPPSADRTALVLGAGGSSRAILLSLLEADFSVHLWNRTRSRADELAAEVSAGDDPMAITVLDSIELDGVSLLVNATSTGLTGLDLPIHWESGIPGLAVDLAYGHGLTTFLLGAQEHGWLTLDGRRMLMEQGALSFELWLGIHAPRAAMWEAITE